MPITTIETFAAPGIGPTGLTWDGALVWNADYKAGIIYGIDPHNGQTRRELLCHGNLSGLAWDGHSLWQSLYNEAMIRRLDPTTNDFDQHIILSDFGWLSGLAWDGRYLWVVAQQQGRLLALEPQSGEVTRTLPSPIVCGDIDFHDGMLWASLATPMAYNAKIGKFETQENELRYEIVQINTADGDILDRYPVERFYTGLSWVNDELWLAHTGERHLTRCRLA